MSTIEQSKHNASIAQRSQLAPFGGTSAASGIVAGVVSLLQAKRRKLGQAPMTGAEMKQHLVTQCPGLDQTPEGSLIKRIDAGTCIAAI